MALTQVIFGGAGDSGGVGQIDHILADTIVSQELVPVATNLASTIAAPALGYRPVCRIATDTTVYVAIGPAPNALTATAKRILVLAGQPVTVICSAGDKAAVVLTA